MIKKINERYEKERAIKLCDSSFPIGLCTRSDYNEICNKIDRYADFFIAEENGNIYGYAAMYNNNFETRIAYITMIGVVEAYQRQNIGSKLMYACIKSAKENGMIGLRLEVLNTNTKAISFYKKFGFIQEKDCNKNSIYMLLLFHQPTK